MKYRSRKHGERLRAKACEYAATVLSGRDESTELTPLAFSLAVFFEGYMLGGAGATVRDFGPKKPVKLSSASKNGDEG